MGPGPLPQPDTSDLSIGLIATLPAEARCLTDQVIDLDTPVQINQQLVCLTCGVGAERAHQAAQRLLALDIKALVSWGTAGALIREFRSGDLFIPDIIYSARVDTYIPDSDWRRRIIEALGRTSVTIRTGPLAETTNILTSARQKSDLHTKTGASATDMETSAIIKSAHAAGLPCIAIRSIVDEADMALPERVLRHTNVYGKTDLLHLMIGIFCAPRQISHLYQLSRAMKAATRTLMTVARETNETLMYQY